MRSTLTALPVGRGDAFLLERDDGTTILVDGGQARLGFPQQLSRHPGLTHLDVVVCTHADADHAEGILGLLEALPIPVHEVWLPGRWTDMLIDLVRTPGHFLDELAADIDDADNKEIQRFTKRHTVEGDRGGEMPDVHLSEPPPVTSLGETHGPRGEPIEAVHEALSDGVDARPDLLETFVRHEWLSAYFLQSDPPRLEAWLLAVATAERIRRIASAAWDAGCTIRWFDFDEATARGAPSGGGPHLHPLNAVEMSRLRIKKPGALEFLRLTMANRESLVFMSEPDSSGAAVLFSADSDLATCDLKTRRCERIAVTAPHHGAAANAAAYARVRQAYPSVDWWIRSDANYRKRPCPEYLAQSQRACTLCRGSRHPKQTVTFVSVGEGWQCQPGVRQCHCT